jgi:predicted phosphodiesterase
VIRIGLVSDSCGDAPLLARALAALDQAGAERLFFLGGRWADADAALAPPFPAAAAARIRARLARVAGSSSPERASGKAPAKVIEMVGGALACLVHDKADLTRDDIANATFLFHGAADAPALVQIGPRFFVTPGRLARPAAPVGGPPPQGTWALLELDGTRVDLVVFGADGQEGTRLSAQGVAGAQVKIR